MNIPKSVKIKRYGLRCNTPAADRSDTREFSTKEARDKHEKCLDHNHGWIKYTVNRTVKPAGKSLWWAVKQLQSGKAVLHQESCWTITELKYLMTEPAAQFTSGWTLAKRES